MKFDRRYWILIGAAVSCAGVSSLSTLYLASVNPAFRECNSVAAACFVQAGMIPCMVLGVLSLPPVMVAIPFLFRPERTAGVPLGADPLLHHPVHGL